MSPNTRFLSRLIGLYCVIVALAMASHRQATVEAITALIHDAPLVFVTGVITAIAGLAIVLNHNVWSGGVTPVMVTLVGWISVLKGALLLFLTPDAESAVFLDGLHYAQLFYLYTGIALMIGVYLTIRGYSR